MIADESSEIELDVVSQQKDTKDGEGTTRSFGFCH